MEGAGPNETFRRSLTLQYTFLGAMVSLVSFCSVFFLSLVLGVAGVTQKMMAAGVSPVASSAWLQLSEGMR